MKKSLYSSRRIASISWISQQWQQLATKFRLIKRRHPIHNSLASPSHPATTTKIAQLMQSVLMVSSSGCARTSHIRKACLRSSGVFLLGSTYTVFRHRLLASGARNIDNKVYGVLELARAIVQRCAQHISIACICILHDWPSHAVDWHAGHDRPFRTISWIQACQWFLSQSTHLQQRRNPITTS